MAPHTFVHPPVHLHTLQGCTHPLWPPMLCASAWFWSIACCGGLFFCLMYIGTHHPYLGCLPLNYTPYTPLLVPCTLLFSGISVLMWAFPLLLKGLGVFPHHLGMFGGHISSSAVHMLILIHFFVVHYVSLLDHSSDYYSSSYSGIFWPVISVISDSGSFPDRVSRKPWCGSTTTLDAEELWRCSWLQFCGAAAYSIFNAFSGLCQLCYGFSTGRFLFQS